MHEAGDHRTHQHRANARQHCDLIGGGAIVEQTSDQWAQEVLEGRFDLVDAWHVDGVSAGGGDGD
ncbi:hypothetical protein D3C76_1801980 [compost metagenome]